MEWNKSMNEKIYCRIRRVRAVLLTFFLTAAVVLTDAQNIREKEYEKQRSYTVLGTVSHTAAVWRTRNG